MCVLGLTFVILPREGGGKNGGRTSFSRKLVHHTKLKTKARIGHNGAGKYGDEHDGRVHGHEIHNGGVRDPNTEKIMQLEKHTEDVPHVDHTHEEALRMQSYMLVKEIRNIFEDMTDSKKIYSYEKWARFLKLLGIRHRPTDVAEAADDSL